MHGTGGQLDLHRAFAQHRAYVTTLERLGLQVHELAPLEGFPDACFVEDTAVIMGTRALLTRPGARTRLGEVESIERALNPHLSVHRMVEPATLDGGDVMYAGGCLFVGRSHRTNEHGHRALAAFAAVDGIEVRTVPVQGALHLKSVVSPLNNGVVVCLEGAIAPEILHPFDVIDVPRTEALAANIICLDDVVLMPPRCPVTRRRIEERGFKVIETDTTEFAHIDGALTCLSILY